VEGLPMFTQAAMAAVRQWRYEPAILDGQPIEAEANIIVGFRLPH
jgi:outer membrane biosynthesis protein TonB